MKPLTVRTLTSLLVSAASALLVFSASANAAPFAYVPNGGNGTVSVIDTSGQTQNALLPNFGISMSAAVAPNGTVAYVADISGDQIFPINTSTNTVGAPIAAGFNPVNVTFSSNSALTYVSSMSHNTISIVDVVSGTLTTTVANVCPVGTTIPVQSVFNGTTLLIVCIGNPSSKVISMDTANGNALTTLATVGFAAYNMAISTASGFGYVSNAGDSTISKFNLTTGATTTYPTTGVAIPFAIAVTPDGSKIYVSDMSGSNLIVMDPSGTVNQTLDLGADIAGIGMSRNGAVLYVPLQGDSAGIKVINTATDTVVKTIANPGAIVQLIIGNFLGNVSAGSGVTGIPTLSAWALLMLTALLGLFGMVVQKRNAPRS